MWMGREMRLTQVECLQCCHVSEVRPSRDIDRRATQQMKRLTFGGVGMKCTSAPLCTAFCEQRRSERERVNKPSRKSARDKKTRNEMNYPAPNLLVPPRENSP
ncbi:hypothetical protein AAFF_G00107360 [Aldrovandia affinis]|uniref:Uncharacterized protein n=1 Tax=Aldrovandia affinis TaxID=143900 RepID=A0AAD7WAV8_9TELE|nr:hypothetical protein AAFF_G00107360 [Aldrovandia affinis]